MYGIALCSGKDVAPEVLETLFRSITRTEIKMSGSGLTGEVNDYLWLDLVRRARAQEHSTARQHHSDQPVDSASQAGGGGAAADLSTCNSASAAVAGRYLKLSDDASASFPCDIAMFELACEPVLASLCIVLDVYDGPEMQSPLSQDELMASLDANADADERTQLIITGDSELADGTVMVNTGVHPRGGRARDSGR